MAGARGAGTPRTLAPDAERVRAEEFARLGGRVYVDHAGAALPSETQLRDAMLDMAGSLHTNPHSQHTQLGGDGGAADVEAEARRLTLEMCAASPAEYDCVFTSGATGAIKLVADAFPWAPGSRFAYTRDNHTSVVGVRGVALQAGAAAVAVDVRRSGAAGGWTVEPCGEEMRSAQEAGPTAGAGEAPSLFAFPLESNFNGSRYDAGLGEALRQGDPRGLGGSGGRWLVLLDAAKGCSTRPPDLRRHKPDFVALSFYKIFGYPTGLGALLVRRPAMALLRRAYFGGGTVAACSADTAFVRRRPGHAGLEDGTPHFLGLAALRHGFALIDRLGGFPAIEAHTQALTRWLAAELAALRHWQGQPVCRLYGAHASGEGALLGAAGQGPTLALNLLRPDGGVVGYREVERLAGLAAILLRGGCFCNPGACAAHLGLSARAVEEHFEAGHVCWDGRDLVGGRPTGAVRVSFGLSSTRADAAAVLAFVRAHFQQQQAPAPVPLPAAAAASAPPVLAALWVYPIKSCRGCRVREWPLGPRGLLLDREWALVGADDELLTLRKCPRLAAVQPRLNLAAGVMIVTASCMPSELIIPLASPAPPSSDPAQLEPKPGRHSRHIHVCAHSVCGMQIGSSPASLAAASAWFSEAVGRLCSLVRQQAGSRQGASARAEGAAPASLGFANEGQLLLMSQASLDDLEARLRARGAEASGASAERFRPNLLVSGGQPAYAEDGWARVSLGGRRLRSCGACARCEVVCADPGDGMRRGPEPLLTLAAFRRARGRINFGVLYEVEAGAGEQPELLAVGMPLHVQ